MLIKNLKKEVEETIELMDESKWSKTQRSYVERSSAAMMSIFSTLQKFMPRKLAYIIGVFIGLNVVLALTFVWIIDIVYRAFKNTYNDILDWIEDVLWDLKHKH